MNAIVPEFDSVVNSFAVSSDIHYRVLRILEAEPQLTQRALASRLGVSLGKANYCLRALVQKGLIKAKNFKNNERKKQYMYILTPKGVREKARFAYLFLKQKASEYEQIQKEIEELERQHRLAKRP